MGKRIKICSQLVVLIAVLYVISGAVIGVTKKIEYHNESIIEIAPTQVLTSKDESTYYFDMISATNNWRLDYSVAFKFRSLHQNVYIYADNEPLVGIEAKNGFFGSTVGFRMNVCEIPRGTSTVKIVLKSSYVDQKAFSPEFCFGSMSTLYKDIGKSATINGGVAFVSVVLGIVLFLLWFASNKNIKKDTSMLYFSMFSVILGIWLFNETELSYTVLYDRGIASLISYVLLLILGIPYVMYVNEYLEVTKLKLSYTIVSLNCVTAIALIIGHATGIYEFRQSAWIINLLLFICLMYTVYGIIWRINNYGLDRRSITTIIGFAILFIVFLMDLYLFIADKSVSDILGKIGVLIYILLLSVQGFSETLVVIQEGKLAEYYKAQSRIDEMTGLYNRRELECTIEDTTDFVNTGIIAIDLNNLKYINDNYGHDKGDKYICWAADSIKRVFGGIGKAYRVGGDEFVVVVNKSYHKNLQKRLSRLKAIDSVHRKQNPMTGLAIGLAIFGEDDVDFETVYKRADETMYEEKRRMKEN